VIQATLPRTIQTHMVAKSQRILMAENAGMTASGVHSLSQPLVTTYFCLGAQSTPRFGAVRSAGFRSLPNACAMAAGPTSIFSFMELVKSRHDRVFENYYVSVKYRRSPVLLISLIHRSLFASDLACAQGIIIKCWISIRPSDDTDKTSPYNEDLGG
jgi:hypothetical protein